MRFCRDIVLAATLAALGAGSGQAAPDSSLNLGVTTVPRAARASTLVAWKPHAWLPPAPAAARATGLRVAIDPVDGTFGMPTAGAFSQEAAIADGPPVQMTMRPNGSGRAQLDDRWADFAVVRLGADGRLIWACVHGGNGAARFMKQPPAPAPAASAASPWVEK